MTERLRTIGNGLWARSRGAKKLSADDPALAQQVGGGGMGRRRCRAASPWTARAPPWHFDRRPDDGYRTMCAGQLPGGLNTPSFGLQLSPHPCLACRGMLWPQELWRLRVDKGGRILFEVAVEYDEESRSWSEMIRLWVSAAAGVRMHACMQERAAALHTAAPRWLEPAGTCKASMDTYAAGSLNVPPIYVL